MLCWFGFERRVYVVVFTSAESMMSAVVSLSVAVIASGAGTVVKFRQ